MDPRLARLLALAVAAAAWTILFSLAIARGPASDWTTVKVSMKGDPAAIVQAVKAAGAPDGGYFRVQVQPPTRKLSPGRIAGLFAALFLLGGLLVGSYRLAREGIDRLFRGR